MSSCKPNAEAFRSDAALSSDTTNRIDYKAWEAERPYVHEQEPYQRPAGDFDFGTTYHKDFPQHRLHREPLRRPMERNREPGPFDGVTNYRESYRTWGVAPRKPAVLVLSGRVGQGSGFVTQEGGEGLFNWFNSVVVNKKEERQSGILNSVDFDKF